MSGSSELDNPFLFVKEIRNNVWALSVYNTEAHKLSIIHSLSKPKEELPLLSLYCSVVRSLLKGDNKELIRELYRLLEVHFVLDLYFAQKRFLISFHLEEVHITLIKISPAKDS